MFISGQLATSSNRAAWLSRRHQYLGVEFAPICSSIEEIEKSGSTLFITFVKVVKEDAAIA